jgi:hypothetical protein
MYRMHHLICLFATVAWLAPSRAHAELFTYIYKGNPFTTAKSLPMWIAPAMLTIFFMMRPVHRFMFRAETV